MKVSCNRASLLEACQIASGAVGTKVRETLRNLKATVDGGGLVVSATDLEIGVRVRVDGDVGIRESGEALLPADHVVSTLRECQDETVDLDADHSSVLITAGLTSEFEFPTSSPETFPTFPQFDDSACYEIAADHVSEMIQKTAFAANPVQDSKFGATMGVLWDVEGSELALVATDGRRMAVARGPVAKTGNPTQTPSSVPPKAVKLVERSLSGALQFRFTPNDAIFRTGGATIYARLFEGRFPAWRNRIPKPRVSISMPVDRLASSIRQAAIATGVESTAVLFGFESGHLNLSARASVGRSRSALAIDYAGEPFQVSFDPKFVLDGLKALDSSLPVDFGYCGPKDFSVLSQGDYVYVMVPISRVEQ